MKIEGKFLGFDGTYNELGVVNGFRHLLSSYIESIVPQGKWFTVCTRIDDSQIDLMKLENAEGFTVGQIISGYYKEAIYRTAIYRYLLGNFMCYVEYPTNKFDKGNGKFMSSYEKMLVTSNPFVMSEWLGIEPRDLEDKYFDRVIGIDYDDDNNELPYVKLTESKQGVRRITCPRSNLDVSIRGCRIIPVFMLEAGVKALYKILEEKVVKINFLKDGGQKREMFTTVNLDKIKGLYSDSEFYGDVLERMYDGDFLNNTGLARGYLCLPEIGGSKYDDITRKISYTRIISIGFNEEPNYAFVNIDLGTVIKSFKDGVIDRNKDSEAIVEMLEAFDIDDGCFKGDNAYSRSINGLIDWCENRDMVFSTVFRRQLCLFMLGNPQWFPHFDGKPKYSYGSTNGGDVGIE